jgi:hypothetical protein
MSHVATIDVQVKDVECAGLAAKRMGGEMVKQSTYAWYGHWMNDYSEADAGYKNGIKPEDYGKCEYAIKFPGVDYEVGLVKRPDGKGYVPIWDFIDSALLEKMGRSGEKFKQAYAAEVALAHARKQGFHVQEQRQANGTVRLVLSK